MSDLLQRARDIAADTYIRLEVERPNPLKTATAHAEHVAAYAGYLRDGSYDWTREVQTALDALRSVAA